MLKMIIIGINAYHGDSSASIFINGKLIAAIEEERLNRIKHWAGLPLLSIQFCLEQAGVSLKEVDEISISKNPRAKFSHKVIHGIRYGTLFTAFLQRKKSGNNITDVKKDISSSLGFDPNEIKAKVNYIEHHRCHMACSYYNSPFKNAAILSLDGMGDFSSLMMGVGKGNKIISLDSVSYPHSLGYFYTCFTQFLGFPNYGDEYKVMGLSSFGKVQEEWVEKLRHVVKINPDGLFKLNTKYFSRIGKGDWNSVDSSGRPIIKNKFSKYLIEKFGEPRKANEPLQEKHKNLAASVQRVTEEAVFNAIRALHKKTNLDDLCLTGGLAQNSVLNGKILLNTPFKNVFIPPNAHDGGTSVGAVLYDYYNNKDNQRNHLIYQTYTGSKFSNEEIAEFLKVEDDSSVHVASYDDYKLLDVISDSLADGKIVGWFQGKSEFGPRALGNRSILADPRNPNMPDHINKKIKFREKFRPFAPSVLEEFVSEYFESSERAPFMEKVSNIKKEKQELIPAVCHVDGTGRLQTVNRNDNPKFYNLIKTFYNKTGIPILLNTSFNENEPIVNSPSEAFSCFKRTDMDILVLENHIISREELSVKKQFNKNLLS